ncbi:MAG: uric acid transporter, partial [Pseudonocardiales bacterium]|nr:uric acid transporter [Pseudonocardiales bacterium]
MRATAQTRTRTSWSRRGREGRRPHPVDEVLPAGKLAVYGVQHVLAFYAGAVIVPILLAGA